MDLNAFDIIIFIAFFALVIGISLFKSRKETSSEDYFLAGRGLHWWLIGISMLLPALGVLCIFEFTFMWNNFYLPLIYLETYTKFPIALGLRMLQGQYRTDMGAMMAATLMAMAPLLIFFYILQRHFVQAIVITGVKG